LAVNQEITELRGRGARIELGHHPERIQQSNPALVVFSSAIRLDNPELQAAESQKIPVTRRALLLAALIGMQSGICVAGMHGKTTTSALLAYALEKLQAAPSYAVGALVPQLKPHARFSSGREKTFFVTETDESDGTLREFQPDHAIVLNLDEEHLDFYANLEAICREFKVFGDNTRQLVVFCADDGRLAELFATRPNSVSYGHNPLAAYRYERLFRSGVTEHNAFRVFHRGAVLADFSLELMGEKNVSNATAVVALLHQLGFAVDEISSAISDFRGAARRQQELFSDKRFRVFDDYGHHPREIEATLQLFREQNPRRLLVAFQPHRFSRTKALLEQFSTCFKAADRLWLTEVYAASELEIAGVNGKTLRDAVANTGQAVEYVAELANLRAAVRQEMQPGDLVLFLGAGDITSCGHQLARELREEPVFPKDIMHAELSRRVSSETIIRQDEPLAKRTTLRVGGTADLYVEPACDDDLANVLRFATESKLPFFILGRGSNLLIRDGGIRGIVISLTHPTFSRIEVRGNEIVCGAGARLKTVSVEARRQGLTGLEFLEGIPGSVGGALRMNAGAMGNWMFEVVSSIRFMDFAGRTYERRASEVQVEYRGCPLLKNHIALAAVLTGKPATKEAIEERMTQFNRKRWDSQPAAPSAGCIFKNPSEIPAGKLIDELGLKGTRVGGAMVSDVHGNFIVNEGNATADDVLTLIEIIRDRARTLRGIDLRTEVEIVGEPRVISSASTSPETAATTHLSAAQS
jgi:UDP-N-acetylmuramate--L-alanine ligase/UDP-N-acetylenolpyruvoylglucosamine reductase